MDLKKIMNRITDITNINEGTYLNICNELKKLIFIIILNKCSSSKLPINEKIKNITALEIIHIVRDKMYLIKSNLINFIKIHYKINK